MTSKGEAIREMLITEPSVEPACTKHFVLLTKEWRFGCDYKLETKTIYIGSLYDTICYEQIICDLNHEYIHFLLHVFVHFVACWKFDNIATLNSDLYNITGTDWVKLLAKIDKKSVERIRGLIRPTK